MTRRKDFQATDRPTVAVAASTMARHSTIGAIAAARGFIRLLLARSPSVRVAQSTQFAPRLSCPPYFLDRTYLYEFAQPKGNGVLGKKGLGDHGRSHSRGLRDATLEKKARFPSRLGEKGHFTPVVTLPAIGPSNKMFLLPSCSHGKFRIVHRSIFRRQFRCHPSDPMFATERGVRISNSTYEGPAAARRTAATKTRPSSRP